jgi:hypothetical protein
MGHFVAERASVLLESAGCVQRHRGGYTSLSPVQFNRLKLEVMFSLGRKDAAFSFRKEFSLRIIFHFW